MKLPSGLEIRNAAGYVLINFATPIVFYLTFRASGAKPAIGFAICVTFLQLIAHWSYRIKFSPFFILASGFTVFFGGIDLFIQSPRFFRLEPFFQNLIMGTVLLISFFAKVPIANKFIRALPQKVQPKLRLSEGYLHNLTLIWAIYLYLKSAVFLYLAFEVDLGELIVLRSVLGGGSLLAMVAGEMIYRKYFHK